MNKKREQELKEEYLKLYDPVGEDIKKWVKEQEEQGEEVTEEDIVFMNHNLQAKYRIPTFDEWLEKQGIKE